MLMSYEESLKILHSHIKTYEKIEKIALTECLGRILAQDIKAPKNQISLNFQPRLWMVMRSNLKIKTSL